jgi:hypothetical protein
MTHRSFLVTRGRSTRAKNYETNPRPPILVCQGEESKADWSTESPKLLSLPQWKYSAMNPRASLASLSRLCAVILRVVPPITTGALLLEFAVA